MVRAASTRSNALRLSYMGNFVGKLDSIRGLVASRDLCVVDTSERLGTRVQHRPGKCHDVPQVHWATIGISNCQVVQGLNYRPVENEA